MTTSSIGKIGNSPLATLTKTKLRNAILKGRTYADIGREFGVTRSAVYQVALKYGFKGIKSGLLYARNLRILRLHNVQKVSINDIAAKFKISPTQIYLIIRTATKTLKNVQIIDQIKSIRNKSV